MDLFLIYEVLLHCYVPREMIIVTVVNLYLDLLRQESLRMSAT